jgi:hypothetical protein
VALGKVLATVDNYEALSDSAVYFRWRQAQVCDTDPSRDE